MGDAGELRERRVQEPAEPDALALALASDAVHAVVPVAGAHQRQAVAADGEAAVEGARAVLEERRALAPRRRARSTPRPGPARAAGPSRNGTLSSSSASSPRDLEVVRGGVGQPQQVVRDAGAGAAARRRMPPVLHVAFDELAAARRAADARARASGFEHRQRHHVLELIAEAVGAARLVERRARPDAAGQRLVEQPAVEQQVHRPIRRRHLDACRARRPSGW